MICIVKSRLPRMKTRLYFGQVKYFARASSGTEGIPEARRNGKAFVETKTAKLANCDPMSMMF